MVTCNMGLEAHWVSLPRNDFDEIISTCQPGPSNDKARAKKMRSFVIPDRFRAENSGSKARTCNVFVAFISASHVWALVDHSRLVRFRVLSSDLQWSWNDFIPATAEVGQSSHLVNRANMNCRLAAGIPCGHFTHVVRTGSRNA